MGTPVPIAHCLHGGGAVRRDGASELVIRRHFRNWEGQLDYSTLERLDTEMIAKHGKKRLIDAGWACRTKDGAEALLSRARSLAATG